jgi:hypothetical protein
MFKQETHAQNHIWKIKCQVKKMDILESKEHEWMIKNAKMDVFITIRDSLRTCQNIWIKKKLKLFIINKISFFGGK